MIGFRQFVEATAAIRYHCTFADKIPSIKAKGLMPSEDPHWGGDLGNESLGRIFYGVNPRQAAYFGLILFRRSLEENRRAFWPVLLRANVSGLRIDKHDPKSRYGTKSVPPQGIEAFWQNRWVPIQMLDLADEIVEWSEEEEQFVDWEGEPLGATPQEATDAVGRHLAAR